MYVSEFKAIFEDVLRTLGKQLRTAEPSQLKEITEMMVKIREYIPMERDPKPSTDTSAAEIKKAALWHGEQAMKVGKGIVEYLKTQKLTYGECCDGCNAAIELLGMSVNKKERDEKLRNELRQTKIK